MMLLKHHGILIVPPKMLFFVTHRIRFPLKHKGGTTLIRENYSPYSGLYQCLAFVTPLIFPANLLAQSYHSSFILLPMTSYPTK